MKLTDIQPDALERFRHAASMLTERANSRASQLLILKEEIARLRSHGVSYRSISGLLTQNGIPTSDVSVMKFCHRFLNEKRRGKSSVKRRFAIRSDHAASPNIAPVAPAKTTSARMPATPQNSGQAPTENSAFVSRGPRIAKVEQLPPGETI